VLQVREPDQNPWQVAVVGGLKNVADDVCEVTLIAERHVVAAPGSHIDIRVPDTRDDVRSYSVVQCDEGGARLAIAVRLSPSSTGGSRYIHGLRPGDTVEITEPRQKFPLRAHAAKYILLAGGIGITPIRSMARTLQQLGADYSLVYVGRSKSAMPYLDELAELHGDRLVTHVSDENNPLDVSALTALITSGVPGTEVYMCGPIRLMDAVRHSWQEAALPQASLRFETFGNSGAFAAEAFSVRVPRLGLEVTVPPDATLLESLEMAGADVMFDCLQGECGLCTVKVLDVSGVIDHRDVFLSEGQKRAGARLCTCVSRVARSSAGAHADQQIATLTIEIP